MTQEFEDLNQMALFKLHFVK